MQTQCPNCKKVISALLILDGLELWNATSMQTDAETEGFIKHTVK